MGKEVVRVWWRGKKELLVHNVACPGNGRLSCIKLQLSNSSHFTIIGVSMLNNGYTDEYKNCLSHLVSSSQSQPIMLVGNFNAHLAGLKSIRKPHLKSLYIETICMLPHWAIQQVAQVILFAVEVLEQQ